MNFRTIDYLKNGNTRQQLIFKILNDLNYDQLLSYKAVVVGTYPIGIDVMTSDVDIICEMKDKKLFVESLNKLFSDQKDFELTIRETVFCAFVYQDFRIEIYGEDKPTFQQNGYRHMLIEHRLLTLLDKDFKSTIIELKTLGLKTEPAFCLLLNIFGNPYNALLELEEKTDAMLQEMTWQNPLKALSFSNDITSLEHVNKGWSSDLKVKITTAHKTYLLRMTSQETLKAKHAEFEVIKTLDSQHITLPKAIEFIDAGAVLAVYTWVEGFDLVNSISSLTKEKQYTLGVSAGIGLKDIQLKHEQYDWEQKYLEKIERVISGYQTCGIKTKGDERAIHFINAHKSVLKNRPITWQHGDYHLGNMILTPELGIGIVDFNRSSTGDPWEEYDRFVFSWSISPYFALGQLKGYFDEIPYKFFELMALYNATNALSAIPWAIPFGPQDVEVMMKNFKIIFDQYEGFTKVVPKWYIQVEKEVEEWDLKV